MTSILENTVIDSMFCHWEIKQHRHPMVCNYFIWNQSLEKINGILAPCYSCTLKTEVSALWCQCGQGMQGAQTGHRLASLVLCSGWETRGQTCWGHLSGRLRLSSSLRLLQLLLQLLPPSTFFSPLSITMISSRVQTSRNRKQVVWGKLLSSTHSYPEAKGAQKPC